MNEYRIADVFIGLEENFQVMVTEEMLATFAKLTGDYNPLHQEKEFAKKCGYADRVVYGMLTGSFLSTLAGMYLPGKYSLIHSFEELSFTKPVFVGDDLTVEAEVTDKEIALKLIRLKVTIKNQDNKLVSKAKMKVLVMK